MDCYVISVCHTQRRHRIGVKWCELYAGGPGLDAAIDAMMNPPKGHES